MPKMIVALSKNTLDDLLRLAIMRFRCRMMLVMTICLCLIHAIVLSTMNYGLDVMIFPHAIGLIRVVRKIQQINNGISMCICFWGWFVLCIPSKMYDNCSSLYSYAFIRVKPWQAMMFGFFSWTIMLICVLTSSLMTTILELAILSRPKCIWSENLVCIGMAGSPIAIITLVLGVTRTLGLLLVSAAVSQAHGNTEYFYETVEEFAVEEEEEMTSPPPAYFDTIKFSPPHYEESMASSTTSISVQ